MKQPTKKPMAMSVQLGLLPIFSSPIILVASGIKSLRLRVLVTLRVIALNIANPYLRFVQAVKSVKQSYIPSPEIYALLEEFRKMVNDCIRIGLAENATSLKTLSKKAYHQLSRYHVPTYYRLTAISKATGILRNYRKTLRKHPEAKKPWAAKLMLTDCYAFKIVDGKLRLPTKSECYEYIPLNGYVLRSISSYTVRSVTLTACTLSIAFSKETVVTDPKGLIGIDRNLDNVTTATTEGETTIYDLSKATQIKDDIRQAKRGFKRNDHRIRQRIYAKYGRIQRNKVNWMLHNVSAKIVKQAKEKEKQFGIVMENLKGLRKLYRKGNGQGKNYRSRLNSWSFYELQRQIEYKARWEGIPVFYIQPHKTSSACAICGSLIIECAERKVYCPKCDRLMDRDQNAALNIVRAGLRFRLKGSAGEAMVKELSQAIILKVDADQLTHHPKS
jgi:putative transposase